MLLLLLVLPPDPSLSRLVRLQICQDQHLMSIHLLTLQCSGSLSPSPRASRQLINNVPPLFGYSATKQLSGEKVCREWKLGCWVLGRAQHRGCQCKEQNLPGTAAAPFVCPLLSLSLSWAGEDPSTRSGCGSSPGSWTALMLLPRLPQIWLWLRGGSWERSLWCVMYSSHF